MRTAALGLTTMCLGCLLFMPASLNCVVSRVPSPRCSCLRPAITVVQVVANPLIVLLGKPATAHSRPHVRAGLQLARDDDLSVRRLGVDLGLARDSGRELVHPRGARRVSRSGDAPDLRHLPRPRDRAARCGGARLAQARSAPACSAARRRPLERRLRIAPQRRLRVRRGLHLSPTWVARSRSARSS